MAVRLRRSPSQLLMPLAFGAHAGSLLALTGTPVNVIVSDYAADAGVGRFGFFEFALVGIPLVVGTIADRRAARASGCCRSARRGRSRATSATTPGRSSSSTGWRTLRTRCSRRGSGVAEVVIPPRSGLIGEAVFPGMVTDSGDLVILAVQRKGEELGRRVRARRRRHAPAAGRVGRARGAPRRPRRARRRRRPSSCAARRCRSGPGAKRALADPRRHGRPARHGRRAGGRCRASRRRRDRAARACSRWSRRTGRSPGRP